MSSVSTSSDRAKPLGIGALGLVAGGITALISDGLIPPTAVMAAFFAVAAIQQYRQR